MALNPEILARSRQLWDSKTLADVLVVFSTDPAAVMRAARGDAATPTPSTAGRLPTEPILPSPQKAAAAGHKRSRDEGPQWPAGSAVIAAHAAQLFSGSEVLGAMLQGTAQGGGPAARMPAAAAAAGADTGSTLTVVTEEGVRLRLLVVDAGSQGMVDAAEPLLKLMYTHEIEPRMAGKPMQLLLMCALAVQLQAPACLHTCTAALCRIDIDRWDVGAISLGLDLLDSHLLPSHSPKSSTGHPSSSTAPPAADGSTAAHRSSTVPPMSSTASHSQEGRGAAAGISTKSKPGFTPDGSEEGDNNGKGPTASADLARLKQRLGTRLVQALGRTARVANDPDQLRTFCSLSGAAVRFWTSSDQLRADSENSVVWLLHAWWCRAVSRARCTTNNSGVPSLTPKPGQTVEQGAAAKKPHLQQQQQQQPLVLQTQAAPQRQQQQQEQQKQQQEQRLQEVQGHMSVAAAHVRVQLLSPVYAQTVLQLAWFLPQGPALCAALLHKRTLDDVAGRLVDVEGWPSAWLTRVPRSGISPSAPAAAADGGGGGGHRHGRDGPQGAGNQAEEGSGIKLGAGKQGNANEGTSAGAPGQKGPRPVLELVATRGELDAALSRVKQTAQSGRREPAASTNGSLIPAPLAVHQPLLHSGTAPEGPPVPLGGKGVEVLAGPIKVVHGCPLQLRLYLYNPQPDGAVTCLLFVYHCMEGGPWAPQVWLPFEAIFSSQREDTPGDFSHRKLMASVISSHRGGRGPADFFGASTIRTAEDLASFMVEDALQLRAELTQLDGVNL